MIALLIAAAAATAHAGDSCSDILSQGIFNQYTLGESEKLRSEFRTWLCASEFRRHEEALEAGIGVGVPIYGVPVRLSGDFSREERESWKKRHCESRDRSESSDRARSVAVREVSALVVEAWQTCMAREREAGEGGLSCRLRGSENEVRITVRYAPRFDADARGGARILEKPAISGARCSPAPSLRRGARVPVQPVTFVCARDGRPDEPRPEARFVLNTDKGGCDVALKPYGDEPVVLEGEVAFPSDVLIRAPRVILRRGARVRVENGSRLEIQARRIVVEEDVLIDGRGARGPAGPRGFSPPGEWTTESREHYDAANGDCATRADHQDRGGQGGAGGQGGRGATLVFRGSLSGGPLRYDVSGGEGGPGGAPGDGRVHLWRGDRWQCANNGHGPTGPRGDSGVFQLLPAL